MIRFALLSAATVFALASIAQTPNTQLDSDFIYDPTAAGTLFFDFQEYDLNRVHALSDGKVMVVGSFREIFNSITGIMRLNSNGAFDDSFSPPAANENIFIKGRSFLELPNGKYLVGGIYNAGQFGGFVTGLMQLNNDGSQDTSFGAGLSYPGVQALALQADGKILIGGSFASVDWGASVARLNTDGSLDNSFSVQPLVGRDVRELTVLPDGRILVAGNFTDWPVPGAGPHNTVGLALLNPDGSIDTSFSHDAGTTFSTIVSAFPRVAVQPDGKIVVAQLSGSVNNTVEVMRYNADLSIDTDFYSANNPPINGNAFNGVTILSDGKIFLSGSVIDYDGNSDISGVFRLNSDGTVDDTFNSNRGFGNSAPLHASDVQSDGKILIFNIGDTYQEIDINANDTYPVRQLVLRLNGDVGPVTSVEASAPLAFNCYPNPTRDIITLDGLAPGAELRVYDMAGRPVLATSVTGITQQLDLRQLPVGTYLLTLTTATQSSTQRVMVQR